ncbi:uncharacterized protein LOC134825421 [Bolinopsis microptera]|uniref:uncharacterized protein LOC134825421 n=1 Tax=Bolinopsis microptera TaxID=2820187 RepID=UPI00307977F4
MGSEASLTCVVENESDNSDITWFKGESQLLSPDDNYGFDIDTDALTSILTIKVLDDTHTTSYSCTYGNDGASLPPLPITKKVKVYVVGYSEQPDNTFSEVGAALTLSCTVQGDAATTITWTKTVEGVESNPTPETPKSPTLFETSSELRISSAQISDSGSYKCSATFGETTVESTVAAVTVLDIGISEDPVRIGFLTGEYGSLSCKVKNPPDNPVTVSWIQETADGDEVVEDQYIRWADESPVFSSTLVYDSATHDNAGVYKCKADYTVDGKTYSRESAPVDLFIRELQQKLDEITLVNLPADTSKVTMVTKVFTCTYKGDDGIESISWNLDGDIWDEARHTGWSTVDGSYLADGTWESTLTVTSLTKTSGKLVKCIVNFKTDSYNNALASESNFVVRSISEAPDAQTISDQASVDISCIYAGTNDPDTVQWRVDGSAKTSADTADTGFTVTTGVFHGSTNNERKTTLTITGREYTDAQKIIKCEFIFSTNLPQETMEASTTLLFRGIVTPLDANYYSIGKDSVSFTCELGVGAAGDVPTFTAWYLNYNEADISKNTELKNEGDYVIVTNSQINSGKMETTLTISSANIAVTLAGKYTCAFSYDNGDIYKSEGNLVVRLVTIIPSDAHIYSYRDDGLQLSCTIESSDTTTGVTWSGPTGFDPSGITRINNVNTYILTLPTDAAASQYSCEFAFTDGPTFKPVGIFLDVNLNVIEMTNPTKMYSTYGVGVTVTFSCSAGSREEMSDLNFWDGTQEVTATRRSYEHGKTNAEYDYVVDTKDKDAEFKCYKSADETSDSTTLDVMTWTQELAESTEGSAGDSVVLLCKAEWNTVDQNKPAFTWLKGATVAEETNSRYRRHVRKNVGSKRVNDHSCS